MSSADESHSSSGKPGESELTSSTSSFADSRRQELLSRAHDAVQHLNQLRQLDAVRLQEHEEKAKAFELTIEKRDEEIASLREKLDSFRISETRLTEENRRLREEVEGRVAKLKESDRKLEEVYAQLEEVESSRVALEEENEDLHSRVQKMSELTGLLKEKAAVEKRVERGLSEMRQRFQMLTSVLSSSLLGGGGGGGGGGEHDRYSSPHSRSRSPMRRATAEEREKRVREAESALSQLQSNRDAAVNELAAAVAAGVGGGELGQKSAREMGDYLRSLYSHMDAMSDVITSELGRTAEIAEKQAEEEREQSSRLSAELQQSNKERGAIESQLASVEREKSELEETHSHLRTAFDEVQAEREDLVEMNKTLTSKYEGTIEELKQCERELDDAKSEVRRKEVEVRDTKEEVTRMRTRLDEADTELKEVREEVGTLRVEVAEKKKEVERVNAVEKQNEELKERYKDLEEATKIWKKGGKAARKGRSVLDDESDEDEEGGDGGTPLKERKRQLRAWSHIMGAHEAARDRLEAGEKQRRAGSMYFDETSSAYVHLHGEGDGAPVPEAARRLLACQAEAEAIPSRLCRELLAEMCSEMGMSSVRGCVGVAQRMAASISCLPRLERFIKDLNALLYTVGEAVANRDSHTTAILPHLPGMLKTIQEWNAELTHLRAFRKTLSRELNMYYQPELVGAMDANADIGAFHRGYNDEKSIVKAVVELITIAEKAKWSWSSLRQSWERYGKVQSGFAATRYATATTSSSAPGQSLPFPSGSMARLSAEEEFQTLFEAFRSATLLKHLLSSTTISGVVPKVQELFEERDRGRVFVESMKTLLGLRDRAGLDDVMEQVRRIQVAALVNGGGLER